MKLFMVGTGGIAHRHIAALKRIEDVELAGVCDLDQAKAERFVHKYSLPARVFTNLATGLDMVKPSAVLLLTPRGVRLPVVQLCVERGIPLLMEKPPCHTMPVGLEIQERLTQSGLIHAVAFPHRYDPALQTAPRQDVRRTTGLDPNLNDLTHGNLTKLVRVSRPLLGRAQWRFGR